MLSIFLFPIFEFPKFCVVKIRHVISYIALFQIINLEYFIFNIMLKLDNWLSYEFAWIPFFSFIKIIFRIQELFNFLVSLFDIDLKERILWWRWLLTYLILIKFINLFLSFHFPFVAFFFQLFFTHFIPLFQFQVCFPVFILH